MLFADAEKTRAMITLPISVGSSDFFYQEVELHEIYLLSKNHCNPTGIGKVIIALVLFFKIFSMLLS